MERKRSFKNERGYKIWNRGKKIKLWRYEKIKELIRKEGYGKESWIKKKWKIRKIRF